LLRPDSELPFPSNVTGGVMSDDVFEKVLIDVGLADRVVPQGFRSSFKDWAAEQGVRYEVSEGWNHARDRSAADLKAVKPRVTGHRLSWRPAREPGPPPKRSVSGDRHASVPKRLLG
jgi:hypothetical protein